MSDRVQCTNVRGTSTGENVTGVSNAEIGIGESRLVHSGAPGSAGGVNSPSPRRAASSRRAAACSGRIAKALSPLSGTSASTTTTASTCARRRSASSATTIPP
jgi:hypothetical protein